MKNKTLFFELALFAGLVIAAVVSRFWLVEIPNFKPVAAIALLSGLFFSRMYLAVALPMIVMLLSDFQLGAYDWPVMLAVYFSLAFCAVAGRFIQNRKCATRASVGGSTAVAAVIVSVVFFVLTNFAVWLTWHEPTWSGLATCYAAAIPFFKYTLLSNVFFSLAGLGSVWALQAMLAGFSEDANEEPATV